MVEMGVKLEVVKQSFTKRIGDLPIRRDRIYHLLWYYGCVDDSWADRIDADVLLLHQVNTALGFIRFTYTFEYPRSGANKIDDGSFGPIILWIGFMWHNGCYTSSGNDLAAGRLVLPHEMYRKLRPIHDTFEVDISGKQVWFWRYSAGYEL
jgi:hypothetical protein